MVIMSPGRRCWPPIAACLLLLGATLPAFGQGQSIGEAAVAELNRYRLATGLDPVAVDEQSAAPLHGRYLSLNRGSQAIAGLLAHTQQAGLPGYTREGAAVAERTNINEGASTVAEAVRELVDVPLHRHWMLAPTLPRMGAGGDGGFWVLDLSAAFQPWKGKPRVVAYPAPGQFAVPLRFIGNEVPNPLGAVPHLDANADVGYPITLHFFGCQPREVSASLISGNATVPSYLIKPGTVLQTVGGQREVLPVLVFPQKPLQPSTSYTVEVTAACESLGKRTYSWPFTTRAALDTSATQVAVGAPDGEGWQSVDVRLADRDRLPVEGANATNFRWSFTVSGPISREPELRVLQGRSLHDGLVKVAFNLGDASSADLQIQVMYDGQTATLPLRISRDSAGQVTPSVGPSTVRIDVNARDAWERAHGIDVVGKVHPSAVQAPPPQAAPPGPAPAPTPIASGPVAEEPTQTSIEPAPTEESIEEPMEEAAD